MRIAKINTCFSIRHMFIVAYLSQQFFKFEHHINVLLAIEEIEMKYNPVGWFEIYVDDMERAKNFYETVLKVKLTALPKSMENGPEMFAWPLENDAKGACGALCKMKNVKPGTSGTLIYFTCSNCQEEAGRVKTAGGELVAEKFSIGEHGYIAIIPKCL